MMETLGDYQLLQEIGRSAFATLYLAQQKFTRRKFALQVLDPALLQDPEFVARFCEQVEGLISLEHSSLVKVHDICSIEGNYVLVLDPILDQCAQWLNLDRYLDLQDTLLSEGEIHGLLLQIASALDYAHAQTLGKTPWVHGSLTLTNIVVGKQEGALRAFLVDFGLMQILGMSRCLLQAYRNLAEALSPTACEQNFKRYRSYFRNFSFLAPEQKQIPSDQQYDHKADIYAFGVLTYYLVTKQFPEGIVEPVSRRVPDLSLSWDLFLRRALDRDPEKRPSFLEKELRALLEKPTESIEDLESSSLFPWKAIERRVENKMQMSFSFAKDALEKGSLEERPSAYHALADTSGLRPVIQPKAVERPAYESDPGAIFQREMSVSRYEPTKIEVQEMEPLLSEMSIVPAGSYFRGSNTGARDEMPHHVIRLASFAIDIHPVTNEQFIRFLIVMGGEKDRYNHDMIRLRDARLKKSGGKWGIESGYAKHPVVGVTWYGAGAYARWVGKRLPTEAEWEVAASGGKETGIYPKGVGMERNQANFFSSDTTPVMSYPQGPLGLYDMAGNVYEWCEDWYSYNYYDSSAQEPENPRGPSQGVYRVLRGGCWKSSKEDLGFSHRHRNNPGTGDRTYGFRCAADVR
ncbi:MAG: SUMF1/EgtB/PvdO family nonheme iron enzyme [Chlamydiota bacterium]